jgi:hypothetical protein
MSDELNINRVPESPSTAESGRRLVPMQVGSATVYIEQVGPYPEIDADDRIYPVAPLSPQEAFQTAGDAVRECVRIVGERIEALEERRPQEITVEFSITLEAKGKAALIPIFVTGETGAKTGLVVKAVWRRS